MLLGPLLTDNEVFLEPLGPMRRETVALAGSEANAPEAGRMTKGRDSGMPPPEQWESYFNALGCLYDWDAIAGVAMSSSSAVATGPLQSQPPKQYRGMSTPSISILP